MPLSYIYETAITIDHEDGVMLVDTSVNSVASQLLRAGFTEITDGRARPYRRFLREIRHHRPSRLRLR